MLVELAEGTHVALEIRKENCSELKGRGAHHHIKVRCAHDRPHGLFLDKEPWNV